MPEEAMEGQGLNQEGAGESGQDDRGSAGGGDGGDPIESLARELNWAPEEEWTGDPEDWVDAKTFILRGQEMLKTTKDALRRQRQNLEGDIREMKKGFEEFKKHQERVHQAEMENMKRKLMEERDEAIQSADLDRVHQLDEDIRKLDTPPKEERPDEPQIDPEFVEWNNRNSWYGKDPAMTREADYHARIYEAECVKDGRVPERSELTGYVEKQMRKQHPELYGGQPRQEQSGGNDDRRKAPSVEGANIGRRTGKGSQGASKYTKEDLTSDQLSVMNTFVKMGVITEQEYIDDLGKTGQIIPRGER